MTRLCLVDLEWREQRCWGRRLRQQESRGWWEPERSSAWGLRLMTEWLLLIGYES